MVGFAAFHASRNGCKKQVRLRLHSGQALGRPHLAVRMPVIGGDNSRYPKREILTLRDEACVIAHIADSLRKRVSFRNDAGILRFLRPFLRRSNGLFRRVLKIKKGGWGIIFLVTFFLSYIFILVITALAIWLSIFCTQDDYAPDGSNYLQSPGVGPAARRSLA